MSETPPVPVDLLVRHAWIVTMDAERRIFRDGAIAIKDDRIVALGSSDEVERSVSPREVIEGADRFVVTPGFVNGHVHITGEPALCPTIPIGGPMSSTG